jgi:hypothetical protein
MHRSVSIGLAGLAGAIVAVAGLRIVSADAQQAPSVGFHAAAVSATQSGDVTYAWFVGQDGGAQFCKVAVQGLRCVAVPFDAKR